jgi:hypothetical protein
MEASVDPQPRGPVWMPITPKTGSLFHACSHGKLIQGRHQPLISVELWERVQGVLDGRNASKAKRGKHDFAFSGLIACAKCGCSVVGEIKKQRYVYYHCTGYADKCLGNLSSCRRSYVREEVLEQKFTELLGQLRSTTKFWNGYGSRSTRAAPMSGAITKKRLSVSRANASDSAIVLTRCISTNSTGV